MFAPVGFILALALTTTLINGEEKVYSFVNMTDSKPLDEIPCPETCGQYLTLGLQMSSTLLGSFLNNLPFPVDFCEKCLIGGLGGFTFEHKCFMNKEKTVFDHYLNLVFPTFKIDCKCNLDNSASETAKKINDGKIVGGQCGMENLQNKQQCKPITCEGDQGGDGFSLVKLLVDLVGLKMNTIIRVDTRPNQVTNLRGAFPLQTYLISDKDDLVTHEGPSAFDSAWKCLSENLEGLVCHLFANFQNPFYDCLRPEGDVSIIHTLLFFTGKC